MLKNKQRKMKSEAIPSRVEVLPPRDKTLKISPALIRGPKDELAEGVKVIVVGPERGHWLAKTTTPDGIAFKSR